jgi:hypothetical protein
MSPSSKSTAIRAPFARAISQTGTGASVTLASLDEAQEAIKEYFRDRAAQEARTVVEEWKESQIYPYEGEATTRIEQAERQVFDIVAVTASQYLPDFSTTASKNKAFHLRLLRSYLQ